MFTAARGASPIFQPVQKTAQKGIDFIAANSANKQQNRPTKVS
jgi:hypothetical protein